MYGPPTSADATTVTALLRGDAGEVVTIAFAVPGTVVGEAIMRHNPPTVAAAQGPQATPAVKSVRCTLSAAGTATVALGAAGARCA